jgi:CRISPR-associated endonuclease/helicase Cas3
MLDVAACADAVLAREPSNTRQMMAEALDLNWEAARPWVLLVAACHDLGKACPGFQAKWPDRVPVELPIPRSPDTRINHAFVSQIALEDLLRNVGWNEKLANLVASAAGAHHGVRASIRELDQLAGNTRAIGEPEWAEVRRHLFIRMKEVLRPGPPPSAKSLSGAHFMLLAGLASFADWIGSSVDWFDFGRAEDCIDLSYWFLKRSASADQALDAINWKQRTPLAPVHDSFEHVFGFPPRPLQSAVERIVSGIKSPSIILIEAPMGEGKTEAAFYAHMELQRQLGHRGLYVALPTKATGNAMFERTLGFLRSQGSPETLDLQLLHGATMLNESFSALRGIYDADGRGEVSASEWFTHKKRALLSEYGVGTVDQALLPILPVRHNFVRLWGLANRVVVFDEIHAYDTYTGTLLMTLLRWLLSLGSSVLLLSATLPPSVRRSLANLVVQEMPDHEAEYPRLSVYNRDKIEQEHFDADPLRRQAVQLCGIETSLSAMRAALEERMADGGLALALLNTVQRAQDLYAEYPHGETLKHKGQSVGKRLSDGTEIYLFHARYPAEARQVREDNALEVFGSKGSRKGHRILIATQVAEQSLDLDFDLIATDLAPIDLLLQRAGRLWRHMRPSRPMVKPTLLVSGLTEDQPPDFGKPLWWGAVYREDVLLLTWQLLKSRDALSLPDEIDTLVREVYEGQVMMPQSLQKRLDMAVTQSDGEALSHRSLANFTVIGFPDDASWNDTSIFTKADEDEPGMHPTLVAQTRLGEPSVVAIPLWGKDHFEAHATPDYTTSRAWCMRAMSITRKGVVGTLLRVGVPEGWHTSPLLRNCFPLVLDKEARWVMDASVRLDDELGLVYEPKEAG